MQYSCSTVVDSYTTLSVTDINECAEDLDNCHQNAFCVNSVGHFTCMCEPGYTGNGVTCTALQQVSLNPVQANPCGKYQ